MGYKELEGLSKKEIARLQAETTIKWKDYLATRTFEEYKLSFCGCRVDETTGEFFPLPDDPNDWGIGIITTPGPPLRFTLCCANCGFAPPLSTTFDEMIWAWNDYTQEARNDAHMAPIVKWARARWNLTIAKGGTNVTPKR